MVQTKKHNKILIGLVAIALAVVCVLLPFIGVKRNNVYAEQDNTTTFVAPTLTPTLVYRQNSTTFYSDSLHAISFRPSVTNGFGLVNGVPSVNNPVLKFSFSNLYDSYNNSGGMTSRTMNIYEYDTTTQLTGILQSSYNWISGTSVGFADTFTRVSIMQNLRFGVSNTAYNGIHLIIYCLETGTLSEGGTISYTGYFDTSLVSSFTSTAKTSTGTGLADRNVSYVFTDRNGVSLVYWFELSSATSLLNIYNNYSFDTYYYVANKIYTSEEQLQDSYNSGYSSGYSTGQTNGYSDGYNSGSSIGYSNGYTAGYNVGYDDGVADDNDYTFLGVIGAVIDAPIQAITGLLNFELFGVNLSALFFGLITVAIIIAIIRYIKGGK
jgi:hypothetical protein